jgi:4'-phosphopantetheinyl transferase
VASELGDLSGAFQADPASGNDALMVASQAHHLIFTSGSAARRFSDLAADDVHIWTTRSDGTGVGDGVLSHEEIARAERLRSVERRTQFKASRAALRLLLGRYLETDPAALELVAGPHGKPKLLDKGHLAFSVSHANTITVIAIARDIEIGIDIEVLRDVPDCELLARRFFAPVEAAALSLLGPTRHSAGFLTAWTRKEAIAKACGEGIAGGLDRFLTPLGPAYGTRSWHRSTQTECARAWFLYDFNAAPGHVGALALSRRPKQIIIC